MVLLSGCRTVKNGTVSETMTNVVKTDSIDKSRHDTQYVFVHDSVFISQKNDTVTREVYRTRYLYRYKTDTLVSHKTDTVYVTRTEVKTVKEKNCISLVFIVIFFICFFTVVLYFTHKRVRHKM